MNALNNVNLAATCVLTSTYFARQLGVPESKWIYPLGGAGTQDSSNCRHIYLGLKCLKYEADDVSLGASKFSFEPGDHPFIGCMSTDL